MTYEEIARLAGVSTATVSRVLVGTGRVSDARRDRVLAAVEQMEYRSNRAARALRRNRADTIGLIVSDVEYPFFAAVARAVEGVATVDGRAVFVCNTDEDLERERLYFQLMAEERVAGVIVSPAVEDATGLRFLTEAGIPVVTVDRTFPGLEFDGVLLDNARAIDLLVGDLLDHGHRHFAAVVGTTTATPSRERLAAMKSLLGRTPDTSLAITESNLGGTVGVQRTLDTIGAQALALLRRPQVPTAFVCANAVMLISVMQAFAAAGIRVPEDAAVVCFDDMPGFELFATPVTVAAQPAEQLGREAARLLLDRIQNPDRATTVLRIAPELQLRRSCGGRH